jgi:hypothetical protein
MNIIQYQSTSKLLQTQRIADGTKQCAKKIYFISDNLAVRVSYYNIGIVITEASKFWASKPTQFRNISTLLVNRSCAGEV